MENHVEIQEIIVIETERVGAWKIIIKLMTPCFLGRFRRLSLNVNENNALNFVMAVYWDEENTLVRSMKTYRQQFQTISTRSSENSSI